MINVPGGVSQESSNEFSKSFGAFFRTLRESGVGCGGFPVPFYATTQWTGYPFYTSASRGPIVPEETSHQGHTNNVWDDQIGGGFTFDFWGGPDSFGIYFEKVQMGHLFLGVERAGLLCETLKCIDPFDFSERAEAAGMGGLIGKDWNVALRKALTCIDQADCTRAERHLDFVRRQIELHLKAQNEEREFDLSSGVIAAFLDAKEVTFTVIIANMITDYLAVSERFYAGSPRRGRSRKNPKGKSVVA